MFETTLAWLKNRENRYTALAVFFFAGLLFSKALLSITVGVFAANWLFDLGLKNKIKKNLNNYSLFAILSIYGILLIGVIYSENLSEAVKDLRIKLPLLVFPLIFATEPPFSHKNFKIVIHAFLFFLICSALISIGVYFVSDTPEIRSISLFINHIRLGLLSTTGSFFMLFLFIKAKKKTNFYAILMVSGALFLAFFTLIILGSFNGLIYFILMFFFWALVLVFTYAKKIIAILTVPLILLIISVPVFYAFRVHQSYFPENQIPENIPNYTAKGNTYEHSPDQAFFENGHPVFMNICESELEEEWRKRSNISINDSVSGIFPIRDILKRYLTSKNLPKDAYGISMLSNDDIRNIENGITNYKLAGKFPLEYRLYEMFQSYYFYKHYKDPNSNSLFMRLEYYKAAWGIILQNPLFGVGTGDVYGSFMLQYEEMDSPLDVKWRRKTHNQYFTMTIATGIVGLFIFLFALIYPPIKQRKFKSYLFLTAYFVLLLSMISEDTIETQVGASIFSFFYAFFLFSEPSEKT